MGWLSGIGKIVTRGLKILPDFLLGTGSEVVGAGMKAAKGSIWTKIKAGGRELEKAIANSPVKGNFFTRTWSALKSLPGELKAAGGFMKGLKVIGKKMPVIGAVLTAACELPNIIGAFKDGGFKAGVKEILGTGVELGGMAAGAAIGSAICPGVGTIIGGIVGAIGGSLIRGKTHTEKKKEAAQQAETDAIQQLIKMGYTEDQIQQAADKGIKPTEMVAAVAQQSMTQPDTTGMAVPYAAPAATGTAPAAANNAPYLSSLNNPFMSPSSMNPSINNYANDIFYQQLFGAPTGTSAMQSQNPNICQNQQLGYLV